MVQCRRRADNYRSDKRVYREVKTGLTLLGWSHSEVVMDCTLIGKWFVSYRINRSTDKMWWSVSYSMI